MCRGMEKRYFHCKLCSAIIYVHSVDENILLQTNQCHRKGILIYRIQTEVKGKHSVQIVGIQYLNVLNVDPKKIDPDLSSFGNEAKQLSNFSVCSYVSLFPAHNWNLQSKMVQGNLDIFLNKLLRIT